MKIATWNINSIRARIDRVISWLDRHEPDVLALQETKCRPDQFPFEQLHERGYHVEALGLNQWNGVALISKSPLEDTQAHFADVPLFGDGSEAGGAEGFARRALRRCAVARPALAGAAPPRRRARLGRAR